MAGKANLVEQLAREVDGINKKQAGQAFDMLFGRLSGYLAQGERVTIPGFGTFVPSEHAAREGHNPKTGRPIRIEARRGVRFRLAKALQDRLNGRSG